MNLAELSVMIYYSSVRRDESMSSADDHRPARCSHGDVRQVIERITADQARELVRETQRTVERDAEAAIVQYHDMAARRIYEAAKRGETELRYLFSDIPVDSRLPVIRRLQQDGFTIKDDLYGGIVIWELNDLHLSIDPAVEPSLLIVHPASLAEPADIARASARQKR
ncbi:hypothetical protein HD841_002942 [Sphingomonas melonis]|uniref:Uncharacterized protein n=1 Tax=Sphingomonas melonis TaxID=152682 RepID=A0A7Y9FPL4_9SPHN|nr:hypothetical protein [Sphingomonas melonis]